MGVCVRVQPFHRPPPQVAGVVVAANEELERRPKLLNDDAFGAGWMLIVRTEDAGWRDALITGPAIGSAFAAWIAADSYKDRSG